ASGLAVKDEVIESAGPTARRVVVDRVDGAAGKAGVRRGDVVGKVGDVAVSSALGVGRGLRGREGGNAVEGVGRRDGRDVGLTLSLDAAPRENRPAGTLTSGGEGAATAAQVWRRLGVRLSNVPNVAEITRAFPQLRGGLLVGEVRPDSPAAKAGL